MRKKCDTLGNLLDRTGRRKLGVGELDDIAHRLAELELRGLMPMPWILALMETEQDEEGYASFEHNVPPPDDWHLTWTRIV